MNQEIAKISMCLKMKSGAEIWIDENKVNVLTKILTSGKPKFIKIGKELINSTGIDGLFSAETMQDMTKRKNGQWKCKEDFWHKRFENCDCEVEIPEYAIQWQEKKEL